MREDPDHFRSCGTCGERYNAFQYGNYFFCSWSCSAEERARRGVGEFAKDEDEE